MTTKKYPDIDEGKWVYPNLAKYKMGCCDCGLVHDLEFQVVLVIPLGNDRVKVIPIHQDDLLIRMRARRNERSTGQLRRRKKWKKRKVKNLLKEN